MLSRSRWYWLLPIVVTAALLLSPIAPARTDSPVSILTQHNDNARTGANLNETILNPSNVNANQFGKLFERPVDGSLYAQPLYVPNVDISGTLHNVVYLATMNNSIYAFDADDPDASAALWQINLGPTAPASDFGQNCGTYKDIAGPVGIVSTPVIDLNTQTLYAVALNKSGASQYYHRLHALDLQTGSEKFGGPIMVTAVVSGTGVGSVNGNIAFDSRIQLQRASLLLSQGIVYFGAGSYCDTGNYHGWVLGYNAATLQQVAVWNSTPFGEAGAVWQSGQGPSADTAGNVYVITGNGTFSETPGQEGYGTSVVKLTKHLTVSSSFTPYNYDMLNVYDLDLGSAGALLIPGTNLALGGGKEGKLYLMGRDNLGGLTESGPDNVVQSFQVTTTVDNNNIHGAPIYWNSALGQRLYVWTESDRLKAFSFDGSLIDPNPVMSGSLKLPDHDMPGGFLSLSANGDAAASGLLWASHPTNENANQKVVSGTLRVYAAAANGTVTDLWNSDQNFVRDQVGYFPKFAPPAIAAGKVYLGSFYSPTTPSLLAHLNVYGLLSPRIVRQPSSQAINSGQAVTLNVRATGRGPLNYQWYSGPSGDTSHPIAGATDRVWTSPPLIATSRFWVRVSNSAGTVDSVAVFINIEQRSYLPSLHR